MAMCSSPSHEATSIGKTRKDLEDEISRYNYAIIDEKIRLNNLTTIARLPPELLSEVFLQYRLAADTSMYHPQPNSWIRITHVCHHWRDIALCCPMLWSMIGVGRMDFIEELLARSKDVPIYVRTFKPLASSESLKRILQESHRIEGVDLVIRNLTYDQTVEIAPASAPMLRFIKLRNDESYAPFELSLPILFRKCDMPALEEVEVHGYQILWLNAIFRPTLTRLVIRGSPNGMPPLSDTLVALENMRSLKHIDLESILPQLPASTQAPAVSRNVALSNLSYLRLSAPGLALANFLDHLVFPSTVVIRLELNSIRGETDLRLVATSITSKLTGATTTGTVLPLLSFAILQQNSTAQGQSHVIEGWTTVRPVEKLNSTYFVPEISISLQSGLISLGVILEFFYCNLPLSKVQSLHIQDIHSTTSSGVVWTTLMGKMPNISKLHISGDSIYDLPQILEGLVYLARNGSHRRTQTVLCQLHTVFLYQSRLRPVTKDMDDNELLHTLRRALTARKINHIGVKKLIVQQCVNMGQHDIDKLKKIVKDVVWDGIEDWEEPDTKEEEEEEEEVEEDPAFYEDYISAYLDELEDFVGP